MLAKSMIGMTLAIAVSAASPEVFATNGVRSVVALNDCQCTPSIQVTAGDPCGVGATYVVLAAEKSECPLQFGVVCYPPAPDVCNAEVVFFFPGAGAGSVDNGAAFCVNKLVGAPTIPVGIVPPASIGCGGAFGARFNLRAGPCAPPGPGMPFGGPGAGAVICATYIGVRCDSCTGE